MKVAWMIWGLMVLGLLVPSLASAQVYSRVKGLACNGCSYPLYEQKAISAGIGKHLVYDLPGDQLQYFEVERERYGANGSWLYTAVPTQVPIDLQTWFERARAAWTQNGGTPQALDVAVHVKVGDLKNLASRSRGLNGYGVVETSQAQNDIADCIQAGCFLNGGGHDTVASNIVGLLQAAAGIFMNDNSTKLTVVVTMDDGSKVTFTWTNGDARPVFLGAVDANNNTIPLQPGDVGAHGGTYSFESYHPDRDSFAKLMNMYGISVSVSQGVWAVACVRTGNAGNGQVVCSTVLK